ncbi:unnamed protein product [Rangifer tarandus platyrhynchus]
MGAPAGLKDDLEALLSCFREMDSVRFEDFFELWRSLKFGTIFRGRMRNLEKSTSAKEVHHRWGDLYAGHASTRRASGRRAFPALTLRGLWAGGGQTAVSARRCPDHCRSG